MGTLHVVATPIGNLEDVTFRAVRVLREADLVLAEDTRRTRKLLDRCGVPGRSLSLHAHNEAARIEKALDVLSGDGSVALVSDAGTPLISDPGERLVAAAVAGGHRVVPIPGASAVLAALSVSDLPAAPFVFLGFLPRRGGPRRALLASYRGRPETLVFFESPRRVPGTLRDLEEALGDRPACVARELTKLHEEVVRGRLGDLSRRFDGGVRGEVTLVVGGATGEETTPDAAGLDDAIREHLARGSSAREIASELARETGLPRRRVYARVVALREKGS